MGTLKRGFKPMLDNALNQSRIRKPTVDKDTQYCNTVVPSDLDKVCPMMRNAVA